MRTGRAARRTRILQSLSPERQKRVLSLQRMIEQGRYTLEGKVELVVDELISISMTFWAWLTASLLAP